MIKKIQSSRGIIRTIILVVIALLILSYFGFNLRSIANSDTSKSNFGYVKEVVLNIWNKYLKRPIQYLWYDIFLDLIWEPAIRSLNNLKDGEKNDTQSSASRLSELATT